MSQGTPIRIGYLWRQAFSFPAGALLTSDRFRLQFRQHNVLCAEITSEAGVEMRGNQIHLELQPDQTAGMKPGTVETAFVLQRDGEEIPIGHRISIITETWPTGAIP